MKKVSFIIPVYNTEQFLVECFESIIAQNMKDIEIICVDDGSTDQSLQIIKEYKKKDSRFRCYQQNHAGVSAARNLGISKATGEFIWFVDSDDMLMKNCLQKLYDMAKNDWVDILVFSGKTTSFWQIQEWLNQCLSTREHLFSSNCSDIIFSENGVFPVVWNKMFRTDFIKESGVLFDERLQIAEDHLFDIMIFTKAEKIRFTSRKGYIYRIFRQDSAMQERRYEKYKYHILFAKIIYENCKEKTEALQKKITDYLISFLYATSLELEDPGVIARESSLLLKQIEEEQIYLSSRSLEIRKYFNMLKNGTQVDFKKLPLLFPSRKKKIQMQILEYVIYIKKNGINKGVAKMFRKVIRSIRR